MNEHADRTNGAFSHIVVPLDLKPSSERALRIAAGLSARADLPVHLVTASIEERVEPVKARLHQAATEYGLQRWQAFVIESYLPAPAIAQHVATLDHPLIVMASPVHGAVSEWLSVSTVAHVLHEVDGPVLVIGPHVDPLWQPADPRLIACLESDWDAAAATSDIVSWQRTFSTAAPWVVEVIDPDDVLQAGADSRESGQVARFVERLAAAGVRAEWEVLHDGSPANGLVGFLDEVPDGIFVVATERWADPAHVHVRSVARELAHRAPRPVLVARRALINAGSDRS